MRYDSREQVHNLPPIRPRAVALLRRFHMDATVFNLIDRTEMRNGAQAVSRRFTTLRVARRAR